MSAEEKVKKHLAECQQALVGARQNAQAAQQAVWRLEGAIAALSQLLEGETDG